jgi:threonine dehydratase
MTLIDAPAGAEPGLVLPTFADIEDAARQIEGVAVRTPLLRSDALDAAVGGQVFVKAEVLQRTGSFKFRGAYNRISRLDADERRAGVVAYSSGNHAQGVAGAARIVGAPAVIVMPADAPALKIENTRALGAEVVLYDRATQSREEIAARVRAERGGATLVPPFDDRFVIAGQGTTGREVAQDLEGLGAQADVLLCPTAGGGLTAGIALAMTSLSPATKLYGVEPVGFDDYARSLAAGHRVKNPVHSGSLCDALLSPEPGEMTFAINQPRLSGVLTVTDEEALAAVAFAFRWLKLVVEPGGAVALAALLTGKLKLEGRTAVVVASGGNIDPAVFIRALG